MPSKEGEDGENYENTEEGVLRELGGSRRQGELQGAQSPFNKGVGKAPRNQTQACGKGEKGGGHKGRERSVKGKKEGGVQKKK